MIRDHVAARTALDDAAEGGTQVGVSGHQGQGYAETLAGSSSVSAPLRLTVPDLPPRNCALRAPEALSQQIAGAGEAEKVRALHGRFVDAPPPPCFVV